MLEEMDLLWDAIKTNNFSAMSIILPKTSTVHKNALLNTSAIMGLKSAVLLLAQTCSQNSINEAFQKAALYRAYDTAQALLPLANHGFGSCLFAVSMNDDTAQCLHFTKLLIPKCSVDEISISLASAIKHRHFHMSECLLPYADPKWNNSEALAWSLLTKNEHLVDVLYPLSEPMYVVKHLGPTSEHVAKIQQRIDAERTKTTLLDEVCSSPLTQSNTKKNKI